MTCAVARAAGALVMGASLWAGGCDRGRIDRAEPPALAALAQRVNARQGVDRLWARATVQVRYSDEDGQRRFEQGEGHLRMQTPDLVALSAGKVGETLIWLGGNERRYWWFDLAGKTRTAFVGEHGGPGRAAGRGGLAATVSPRDLSRLMGLAPLAGDRGAVQWSDDGRLIGVTTDIDFGRERRWLDPDTLEAVKIEWYPHGDSAPTLVADLGDYQAMKLAGQGAPGPRVPTSVFIGHLPSATVIRLYLSEPEDGGGKWDAGAFEFERLLGGLRAERVVDLDAPAAPIKHGY